MKHTILLKGFLLASLVALPLAGCKKKDNSSAGGQGTSGSAGSAAMTPTTPATGSGSAMSEPAGSAAMQGSAAAGSAAAGSAAGSAAAEAPMAAPPAGKLVAKRNGNDEGVFDGDKALYVHKGSDYKIFVPSNCDKFACAHIDAKGYTDDEKLSKACPSAKLMEIDLNEEGDPKVGDVQVMVSVNGFSSGGGLTANWTDGGKLTAVGKEYKGTVDIKDGNNEAHGSFVAKPCK